MALTDKQRKKIIADYVEMQNFTKVAKLNDVNPSTVKRLVDKGYDNVQEKARQKKEENTQSTLEYMQQQHETKKKILDKILKAMETKADDINMFTNIKDLATAYGIILDKELKILELTEMKNSNNKADEINKSLVNIATLINNPKPTRQLSDFDE